MRCLEDECGDLVPGLLADRQVAQLVEEEWCDVIAYGCIHDEVGSGILDRLQTPRLDNPGPSIVDCCTSLTRSIVVHYILFYSMKTLYH